MLVLSIVDAILLSLKIREYQFSVFFQQFVFCNFYNDDWCSLSVIIEYKYFFSLFNVEFYILYFLMHNMINNSYLTYR